MWVCVFPHLLSNRYMVSIYKFYFQFTFKNGAMENRDGINRRPLQNIRGNARDVRLLFYSLYISGGASCRIAKLMSYSYLSIYWDGTAYIWSKFEVNCGSRPRVVQFDLSPCLVAKIVRYFYKLRNSDR